MSNRYYRRSKRTAGKIVSIVLVFLIIAAGTVLKDRFPGFFAKFVPGEQVRVDSEFELVKHNTDYLSYISLDDIPEFSGEPSIEINENEPFFTDEEKKVTEPFERYSEWDYTGRCGTAYANICADLMPSAERGDISSIYPTGWKYHGTNNNNVYDFIDNGGRIYNRCHLIAFMLAGENANPYNLITGTRYFNINGMLPYESAVKNYAIVTGNHVLYRVTPMFKDRELVCRGVLIEAWSVEDDGNFRLCVFSYNVQADENGNETVKIDYSTGRNEAV